MADERGRNGIMEKGNQVIVKRVNSGTGMYVADAE